MKTLINPRLTFVLGVVVALVTVWCNAVPARVDAGEMSEVTGGSHAKCEIHSNMSCDDCSYNYDYCYYNVGDNNMECKDVSPATRPCDHYGCTNKSDSDQECK